MYTLLILVDTIHSFSKIKSSTITNKTSIHLSQETEIRVDIQTHWDKFLRLYSLLIISREPECHISHFYKSCKTETHKNKKIGKNNLKCRYSMRKSYSNERKLLKTTELEKYLDMNVDVDIKYLYHIENQVNKANQILGLILRSYECWEVEKFVYCFELT